MGRVDPAVAAARNAVRTVLAELGPDDLVLVACSGGADSLALAAATAYEARRVGRSVRSRGYAVRAGAVIVDHGLQPGSAEVAEQAAARCRALGLSPVEIRPAAWPAPPRPAADHATAGRDRGTGEPFRARGEPDRGTGEPFRATGEPDRATGGRRDGRLAGADEPTTPPPGPGGPEGRARAARYAAVERVAQEAGARLVLLGHTLDDQAEQVLLGLARGAGARSLAGMPRARGVFRRPFLGLRRAQTEAVCAALGLEFWTDPTNLLPDAGSSQPGRSVAPRSVQRVTDLEASDRPRAAEQGFVPLRSQVRGRVLPVLEETLGPGVVEALGRSADQLRDDADLLDALAADLLDRARTAAPAPGAAEAGTGSVVTPPAVADPAVADPAVADPVAADPVAADPVAADPVAADPVAADPAAVTPVDDPDLVLDIGVLEHAHPALRRRVLRLAALAVGCPPSATTARHVDALDALVVSWAGQGPVHLPGGARGGRACGRLFLRAAPTGTPDGGTGVRPPTATQE